MQKLNRTLMLAGAGIIAVLTSCGSSDSARGNRGTVVTPDGIKTFEVRESILSASRSYLMEADDDSCYLTLSTYVQWPDVLGGYDIKPLQDSIIAYAYPEVKLPVEINSAILTYIGDTSLLDDDVNVVRVDSVPTLSSRRSYEMESNVRVIELTGSTVTYQVSTYSYTGGAHPNYGNCPFSYDFKNARVLTLDNIFKSGSEQELSKILAANLASQFNVAPDHLTDAGLFTNDIPVSPIVYLRNGNVMFHYNPYDIAPYSYGMIDVEVYFYQIKDLLTPEAVALVTR